MAGETHHVGDDCPGGHWPCPVCGQDDLTARLREAEARVARLKGLLRECLDIRRDGGTHRNGPDAMWARWHSWGNRVRDALKTPKEGT